MTKQKELKKKGSKNPWRDSLYQINKTILPFLIVESAEKISPETHIKELNSPTCRKLVCTWNEIVDRPLDSGEEKSQSTTKFVGNEEDDMGEWNQTVESVEEIILDDL